MKTTLTDFEWYEYRNQLRVDLVNLQSKTQSGEVFVKQIELHPGQSFRFQCSCGAIHQHEYIETPEGRRLLSVK
jgi:hypothetical protein